MLITIDAVTHNAVENTRSYPKQLFTTVRVNNSKDMTFQLDCSATCNLLPLKKLSSILEDPTDLYLKKTSATLKMCHGSTMYPLGKCTLRCTKGEVSNDVDFFVVYKNVRPLLGAQTCQELNFIKVMVSDGTCPETVRSVNDHLQTSPSVLSEEWILKEYSDVFEGLGCMGGLYQMEVDETVRPVLHPPRKVPVALRDRLKEELDKLVKEGIITPVTEPAKRVSSLVIVKKPEKLRICIGPQDLNEALPRSHYPLPTIKDVATRLSKAKVFSVLDAKNGFWQVKLDTDSSYLTTFNTPFGRFRWLPLLFGVKTTPEEYQRRIHESLRNLSGIEGIVDDILWVGEGDTYESAVQDHDKNLIALLDRCR